MGLRTLHEDPVQLKHFVKLPLTFGRDADLIQVSRPPRQLNLLQSTVTRTYQMGVSPFIGLRFRSELLACGSGIVQVL